MTNILPFSYERMSRSRERLIAKPVSLDIYRWCQEMQKSYAIWFDPSRASWMVFHYNDVQRVLLEHQTFSSQRWIGPDGEIDPIANTGILGLDPPRHRQLRSLISMAFTPRVVANLEPRISAIVHSLLDQVAGRGEMDIVEDLASPLAILVIAELLGVPTRDRELFREWSIDLVGVSVARRIAAAQAVSHYFQTLYRQRLQDPCDDLISGLISAEVDGNRLPEEEIIGTCNLILVGGHATAGLLGNAIVCLDEHLDSWQELLTNPDLLPSAVEEILRYRGISQLDFRVALTDTVLAGQEIMAGELVSPLFASANLDEKQFPNADTFDIHRTPNRHLGFSHGIHFCLGAPLARLETRITLGILLERFPKLHRICSVPLALKPSYFLYELKHVSVKW